MYKLKKTLSFILFVFFIINTYGCSHNSINVKEIKLIDEILFEDKDLVFFDSNLYIQISNDYYDLYALENYLSIISNLNIDIDDEFKEKNSFLYV